MSRRVPGGLVLFVAVAVVVLAVLITLVRLAAEAFADPPPAPPPGPDPKQEELDRARRYNRKLERVVHRQVTRAERNERRLRRARWTFRRSLGSSPVGTTWLEQAFICVHHYEGSWTDAGDPYWGGLQMDRSFMRTYGGWAIDAFGGYANRWPISVQIATAIRAHASGRGFHPWPATARRCGLL